MTNIELLQKLVEESQISDRQYAELTVLLNQTQFYLAHKAGTGDLYAQNIVDQMVNNKEIRHES